MKKQGLYLPEFEHENCGAGLLIDIPHDYFKRVCDFSIPKQREYAVAMAFLPKNTNQYNFCKTTFENEIKAQGLAILGWREVPVDSCQLGEIALASEPNIEQLFIGKTADIDEATFKAKLYAARKIAEHNIRKSKISESTYFYVKVEGIKKLLMVSNYVDQVSINENDECNLGFNLEDIKLVS